MVQFAGDGRPLPRPTPTTKPFFDAARKGVLALQRCPRDGVFYYPRSHCPSCLGTDWEWQELSGRGEVHTFTVDRVGHDPALASQVPFAIAVVELDEGVRVVANVVGCEVDDVKVGLPVEATFETIATSEGADDVTLLRFQPRGI